METLINTDPHASQGEIERPATHDAESIETAESRRKRYREEIVKRHQGHNYRLKQFLLDKRKYFRSLDVEARRLHMQEIDLMFRYFKGDQYGFYDERGNYKDQKQDGDFAYTIPILAGHVGQAFVMLLKTRPEYKVVADDNDDMNMRLLASMCQDLGTKDLKRLMHESNRQTEIINSILAGDSYREVFWSPDPKAPRTVKRAKTKVTKVPIPARLECMGCKAIYKAGTEKCARCGVASFNQKEATETSRTEPDGYETVELGENRVRIPHPMGLQRDFSAVELDDSTFIIVRDFADKHVAEWDSQTMIERGDLPLSEEMQARYDLERSGIQTSATVGANRPVNQMGALSARKIERERHFWDVSQYGQFYCTVEETLPNPVPDPFNPGQMTEKIPAGTLLGDFFPNGLYVRYDGDTIMTMWPTEKKRRWSQVTYSKQPGSAVGMGMKMAVPLQDIVNDDYNLYHAVKSTSARPFTVIAGNSVKLLPEAGNLLRLDRLPPGVRDIRAVIAQFAGQSVAGMDAVPEKVQGAMQFILGTSSLGGGGGAGAPDMRVAGTATGVAAMQEQGADRQRGPIGLVIAADKETIFQCLENRRDFSSPEQKKELVKRYGEDIVKLFFECNFRQVLSIEVAPNTDVPRSLALTQAMTASFAELVTGLAPLIAQVPWVEEVLSTIAESMGMPVSIGPARRDRREAERRLNMLLAIEEQVMEEMPEALTDPVAAAKGMYMLLSKFCHPLIQPATVEPPQLSPEQMAQVETLPPEQRAQVERQMQMLAEQQRKQRDLPRIFMQDHQAFMDTYMDAYFSERANAWSDARKIVVRRLWQDHFSAQLSAEMEKAALMKDIQDTVQPPPDPALDAAQGAAQEEAARAAAEEERAAAQEDADIDHERSEEAKEAEHRRKLELEGRKEQAQLMLAQTKKEGAGAQA